MTNILILNWNSFESVKYCISSIVKSYNKNYRIILINNFSTISDLNEIKNLYNIFKENIEIYLIENKFNHGYAGGNNAGIKFLIRNNLPGHILILNPDIQISRNTISEMGKALDDDNDVGIVTVRTLNTKGEILFDSIKLKGFSQKYIKTNLQKIETDYSQGSCMLINRNVINQIGFFDERFFLYWEEVDFSLRVKKHGKKLISLTTTNVIRNTNSITRQPLAFYYSIRNAKLIKNKHNEIFSNLSYILYVFKMFILTLKFITNPSIFKATITNFYLAIIDSYSDQYYAKR